MNENQVGVILEEVRDMFKVLAEGQKVIEQDVAELKYKVTNLEQNMERIEQKVTRLEQNVERIEVKLDAVVQCTAQTAEKVTDHEVRITVLEEAANL